MSNKTFWEEWSGNFPITLTYKAPNDSLGTPEGVEVERAGQKVFLNREDIQVALGLFDDPEPGVRMIDTYDDKALRQAFGTPEPQGEPSDAQLEAALHEWWYGDHEDTWECKMRAALRAAMKELS